VVVGVKSLQFAILSFLEYPYTMNYQNIITIEPGKRGGQPTIRGMRISVYDILKMLASGMSHKQILDDFSELTEKDIQAVLSYASDREHSLTISSDEITTRPKHLAQAHS